MFPQSGLYIYCLWNHININFLTNPKRRRFSKICKQFHFFITDPADTADLLNPPQISAGRPKAFHGKIDPQNIPNQDTRRIEFDGNFVLVIFSYLDTESRFITADSKLNRFFHIFCQRSACMDCSQPLIAAPDADRTFPAVCNIINKIF